jgi:hypothetical protein
LIESKYAAREPLAPIQTEIDPRKFDATDQVHHQHKTDSWREMNPYPNPYGLPAPYAMPPMMAGGVMNGAVLSGRPSSISSVPHIFPSPTHAASPNATHATNATIATIARQCLTASTYVSLGTKWNASYDGSQWSSSTSRGTKHHSIDLYSPKLAVRKVI